MKTRSLLALATGVVLLTAACGGGKTTTQPQTKGASITVGLSDFDITPSRTTIPAGHVTFHVTGQGPSDHEFVVIKTDLTGKQIPVKDGEANEDANGLIAQGEVENLATGDVKTLSLDLLPGRYLFLCNEPGHFLQGMYTFVTVT
jgi:uncharacterized cupredoxin-like copper-binding protein